MFLDQGLKKATGAKLKPNIRPDVTVIYKDGTVSMIEIASKTDKSPILERKIIKAMTSLPESMQGTTDVKKPKVIINQGRKSNK